MDLIIYGLLNKAKANLDSPAFTGTPTAPTPLTPDNSNKLATTEFVRSVIATLKGFYLGVTTTTLVDEVTTDPDVVINGETVTAQDGNWVIAEGGEEFVYSGTVWQKFGDSNWISVIGNTYNPALTYNTGDCVIYMDGLYECKEDNVTGDWDSTKWQATTVIDLITGGIPLENLSNVTITNPQAGNHLVFDGTEWKNSTVVSPALSELSDVNLENTTDGQALVYNDTTDKWENQDISTEEVTKKVTGNPIELSDAASAPIVKCETEIQGSQDLHGYDKPWVGGAGKNKCDKNTFNRSGTIVYNPLYVGDGDWTMSTDCPVTGGGQEQYKDIFFLPGNVSSGASSSENGVIDTHPVTVTAVDGYVTVASRYNAVRNDPADYNWQIEAGTVATAWTPYENICPITAYTEGEIEERGKNLWNEQTKLGYYSDSTGAYTSVSGQLCSDSMIPVSPSTSYRFVKPNTVGDVLFYDESQTYISAVLNVPANAAFATPNNCRYININLGNNYGATYNNDVMIEEGTTATTYEPYTSTTHTTTYPSAIYRGSEDVVNGTVECEVKYFTPTNWSRNTNHSYYSRDFMTELASTGNVPCICDKLKEWDGEEPTTNNGICFVNSAGAIRINTVNAYASVEDMVADMGEMHFACTLPTPTTSSVTPTNLPIKSLFGYNHIESSTGDMEVEYITQDYQPIVDLIEDAVELPAVTSLDDGKVLTVVDGKWVAASLPVGQNIQY